MIECGWAKGGTLAALEALTLWGKCAVGRADYTMLVHNSPRAFVRLRAARAAFEAAVSALRHWEFRDTEAASSFKASWRRDARKTLLRAAGHLLAACQEVERTGESNAWFEKSIEGHVVAFRWEGYQIQGEWIWACIDFRQEFLQVGIAWNVWPGVEHEYPSLPSMTDEAELPQQDRREEGWFKRASHHQMN